MEARDPVLRGREPRSSTVAKLAHVGFVRDRGVEIILRVRALLCHRGQIFDDPVVHRVVPQEDVERVVARAFDDAHAPGEVEHVFGRTRRFDRRVDLAATGLLVGGRREGGDA